MQNCTWRSIISHARGCHEAIHALADVLTSACSLKAYKLGKRRWSYNQCQLIVQQEDGSEQLNVMEAMANGNDSIQGDYQVRPATSSGPVPCRACAGIARCSRSTCKAWLTQGS